MRPVVAGGSVARGRALDPERVLAAGSSPWREPRNMAGRARAADLHVCATVMVEGRSRLVPVDPGVGR